MLEFLNQIQILGNTGRDYAVALAIFIGILVSLKIIREIILNRLKKLAEKTKTDLDDILVKIVRRISPPFYLIISIYIALKFLVIHALAIRIIDIVFLVAVVIQVVRILQVLIDFWTQKLVGISEEGEKIKGLPAQAGKSAVKNISYLLKIVLWAFALLIILSNLGVNVNSLIAGLGIGGLAIAFALQNILQDIFSSFSILIDKPFRVGDFIIVGSDMGTVEKIGIKSTRIKTLQGQELVISNQELTSARVNNYKKMEKRRVVFALGATYETPSEKLEKMPGIIKNIIDKANMAEFDRAHFKEFGDFSLNYEIVYYIDSPDYNQYMDTQESINLAIKEAFEKEGIEFAYPTQTLFVKK